MEFFSGTWNFLPRTVISTSFSYGRNGSDINTPGLPTPASASLPSLPASLAIDRPVVVIYEKPSPTARSSTTSLLECVPNLLRPGPAEVAPDTQQLKILAALFLVFATHAGTSHASTVLTPSD